RVDAGPLGLCDEIGLGEVQTIELVDLKRSKKHRGINRLDRTQPDRRPHQVGDARSLDFVERLQDIDAFREHEICQQEVILTPKSSRGSRSHLRRVAGQVADHDVRIDERCQRCRPARAARVRLRTSSHGVPCLPAGTATVPASSKKSGVFAITARERSTRNSTSSPSWRASDSRTLRGIVSWPLDVILALASIRIVSLLSDERKDIAAGSSSCAEHVTSREGRREETSTAATKSRIAFHATAIRADIDRRL